MSESVAPTSFLLEMGHDVWPQIILLLGVPDLCALACTCTALHHLDAP